MTPLDPAVSEAIRLSLREELCRVYPEKRYLTVPEAAKYMGCGKTLVYQLLRNGQLPFSSWHDDGVWRIDRHDIDRIFEKRKNI